MHAGWNLLVRNHRGHNMFLTISAITILIFFPFAAIAEFFSLPVLSVVPLNIVLGGLLLAIYYVGMTNSYRGGDFTVAYPLARALPVLVIAGIEATSGESPTLLGWIGILLIAIGTVIVPLQSLDELSIAHYWNRTTLWILLAALGIVGYTVVDQAALRQLPNGLTFALRYAILESAVGGFFYFLILRGIGEKTVMPKTRQEWKYPFIATFFVFGSYSLILWAFQSDDRASYVIGLRQISIVLGVVGGAYLFHEKGARLRIPAALVITAGVILLSFA